MKSKIAGILTTLLIAFTILSISVLRSASPKYAYSPMVLSERTTSEKVESNKPLKIDYLLAYPGKINPDSSLWYLKVIRDKAWYFFTFNKDKKPTWAILHLAVITAGLALLPLVMSKIGTIIFGQTSFGALLYWAYAAVFATFAGFLLVGSKYYHKKAPFSDYGYIDRAYSLVYLFGQTALTWLIFAGSLR